MKNRKSFAGVTRLNDFMVYWNPVASMFCDDRRNPRLLSCRLLGDHTFMSLFKLNVTFKMQNFVALFHTQAGVPSDQLHAGTINSVSVGMPSILTAQLREILDGVAGAGGHLEKQGLLGPQQSIQVQ
ncbi:hypothetical protein [Kocuria rosea]|uniref:hypothetical protein n=1 Tax=Kocuria rosea TaxID=1275 RepID=UPI0025B74482|nr:hypothetical protein [Kocuria rosea]WJZ65497.1 hypothetical protein QR564_12065 [Kocuria rosea]